MKKIAYLTSLATDLRRKRLDRDQRARSESDR